MCGNGLERFIGNDRGDRLAVAVDDGLDVLVAHGAGVAALDRGLLLDADGADALRRESRPNGLHFSGQGFTGTLIQHGERVGHRQNLHHGRRGRAGTSAQMVRLRGGVIAHHHE